LLVRAEDGAEHGGLPRIGDTGGRQGAGHR
jgi:hypothetical protein